MNRAPVLFVSHGGGPMPLLGDPSHKQMVDTFKLMQKSLPKPKAIIVISAHWESKEIEILTNPTPPLLFDYYGFPESSYQYQYPIVNSLELIDDVKAQLQENNIAFSSNDHRGYDHGVFVPLMMLYPDADIPVIQISLQSNLDPERHLALGQSLSKLRDKGVMIIGSGYIVHNMKAFFMPDKEEAKRRTQNFVSDVDQCLLGDDKEAVNQSLIQWQSFQDARFCHPREEHLLPLHTCVGATMPDDKLAIIEFDVLDLPSRCYLWQ